MCNFDKVKSEISDIIATAQEVVGPKIAPVNEIIKDIKVQLVHGTDRIPTSRVQEWSLSLSVINTELSPHKEAFALASSLWKVDINNSKATTLAERRKEQTKVDIENQNIIDTREKETQKIIIDYMSSMINETQKNVGQLLVSLNRILDARNWNREAK